MHFIYFFGRRFSKRDFILRGNDDIITILPLIDIDGVTESIVYGLAVGK